MSSRTQDLLGRLLDTALEPDDPDPTLDDRGMTGLRVPAGATIADDTEEDDAFEALRDDLSPGEASEVVETMRPLSREEQEILRETPGLKRMTRVDDAEQEEWLAARTLDGYKGMDNVLDDAIYGDANMKMNEEQLERLGLDTDLEGWGFSSLKNLAKKAGGLVKKSVTAPLSATKWVHKKTLGKLTGKITNFIMKRDLGKANVLKNLYKKLDVEHANFLAKLDASKGLPLKPTALYRQVSKAWAKDKIKAAGLPTTYAMGKDEILGADIMGSDVIGSWYNPFSWFSSKAATVVQQTADERATTGPDGMPAMAPAEMPMDAVPVEDPSANPAAAEQYATAEPEPESAGDPSTGICGEDSLGAFATEIMGGVAASPEPKTDQLVAVAKAKLRAGQPITSGELAVLGKLAGAGHPGARRVYDVLLKYGVSVRGDDESGAWMHKLNPMYWLKSAQERKLVDTEKEKWIENADLQKKLGKQKLVLDQAERAKAAAQAVEAAKAQAAATEAQLKEIEASISGAFVGKDTLIGAFVGHEKPTAVAEVMKSALARAGLLDRAKELLEGKVAKGEPLSKEELADARKIGRVLQKVKVVHGDLLEEKDPASAVHGAFVGACVVGAVGEARKHSGVHGRIAARLSQKIAAGLPLSPDEVKLAAKLRSGQAKLRDFARSHVTGAAFVGLDNARELRRASLLGAAKVMTEAEKKMVSAIVKLAKAGNPQAVQGLQKLRATGTIMGGDVVGSFISDVFNKATSAVSVPLSIIKAVGKGVYRGGKWIGQKAGLVSKGGSSPEQVRLAKLRAAAKRRTAALARARAADAQTEAELRAQQSIADAADAEAEAADADALSKEAQMRTREIEADPSLANTEEDSSGSFVGGWQDFVGDDVVGKVKAKKILARAAEKSPVGAKIRSGAALYRRAKAGDARAKRAIVTMVARAKKGDQQAVRDTRAVQAGRLAVIAKQRAQKKQVRVLARKARRAKVVAFQKKVEARIAQKLVRVERKHDLRKLARVERKAAAGNRSARAYVAKQVAAAKRGDKKAAGRVEAMKLGRVVRSAAPNKRERRNLVRAQKLVDRGRRGDPKAIRQIRVVQAAAKQGNPNAKRAMKRLAIGAAVASTVATGVVLLPGRKKGKKNTRAKQAAVLASARAKAAAGTASREELAAGARAAQDLGDRQAAGALAVAATSAPSATERLKKTATVVAAKEAGNEQARAAVAESFEKAKEGDPEAIKKTANVVAVQTIDDVNKGRPVTEAMKDAQNLNERVAAGDPAAVETVKKITEAATAPNPSAEATYAAVTLAAAATISRALAAKPKAKQEFLDKVNQVSPAERTEGEQRLAELVKEAKEGTISPADGVVAERLAERLGKPKVAAEIAALAPPAPESTPMSSLPDMPLPPIAGALDLVRESLRALTLSTRDPLANYRGGVRSRSSRTEIPIVSGMGWSPFAFFKSLVKKNPLMAILSPATAITSAAAMAVAASAKKAVGKGPAPEASPPAPAATPTPAPAAETTAGSLFDEQPSKKEESKKAAAAVSALNPGVLPAEALRRARRSAEDVLPPDPKTAKKGSPVSSLGADRSFKDYVKDAVRAKKMSRADFNRAIEVHLGKGATPEKKTASGEKVLAFLAKKGVKVES